MTSTPARGFGSGPRREAPALALALTQILGWGSTFYLPVVLEAPLRADLDLSKSLLFGGVTVMLLASAVAAAPVGRAFGTFGPRRLLVAGSALIAVGLVVLALAAGPVSYLAAWLLFGLANPMCLSQGAFTALHAIAPDRARRAITIVTLGTALTPTLVWPALAAMEAVSDWRVCCGVLAALNLVVGCGLHASVAPGRGRAPSSTDTLAVARTPPRGAAVVQLALAFALTGLVSWGLSLHLVGMAQALGHSQAAAIALGAIVGPAQIVGRLADLAFAKRLSLVATGALSLGAMVAGLAVAALAGRELGGLWAFVLLFGLGAGTLTIVRAGIPAELFGAETYAEVTARMAGPQNLALALAPLGLSALLEQAGVSASLWLAFGVTLMALLLFAAGTRWRPAAARQPL